MTKIKKITFEANSRIIVVSDIHGCYNLLEKLLLKINYQKGIDYLILLGDFSQKGPYPLKTLRYIMKLSLNNYVYPILGNCDRGNYKVFFDEQLNTEFKKLLDQKNTLLYDMKEEYQQINNSFEIMNLKDKQKALEKYFENEINFLKSLPLMIETKDFIFVHAGIDKIRNYEKTFYQSLYMRKYFYFQGHLADKFVVCGHMPVTIYTLNEMNDNIIIDEQKKIISIDGGLMVKEGGQLNGLIINYDNNKFQFEKTFVDDLPQKKLQKSQEGLFRGKGICWPYYNLEILERGQHFSKIKIIETNEITFIKNEYLKSDYLAFDDCAASILNIKKGEVVGIVNDNCSGYVLVKYKGIQGWINKGVLDDEI